MGRLCGIVSVLVSSTLAGGARPASAQSSPLKEFTDLLAMQYQAISAADTTVLGPLWAPQLVWVLGPTGSSVTRSQLMAAVSRPQSPRPRFEVDQVQIRQAGTAVIVDYRRRDTRQVAGYQMATVSRVVDVFAGPRSVVSSSRIPRPGWYRRPLAGWLIRRRSIRSLGGTRLLPTTLTMFTGKAGNWWLRRVARPLVQSWYRCQDRLSGQMASVP